MYLTTALLCVSAVLSWVAFVGFLHEPHAEKIEVLRWVNSGAFAANWTLENTPADLSATESWAIYSITADIDTPSTKNIAIFIWTDVAISTFNDGFGIADVQLESGTSPSLFEQISIEDEYSRCLRYYMGDVPIAAGGYALARIADGQLVRSHRQLERGMSVQLQFAEGGADTIVNRIIPD